MDTLFPTSLPTLKPTYCFSLLNKHPDTQKGIIICFTVLGSVILIFILIIKFCCKTNSNSKPTIKHNNLLEII